MDKLQILVISMVNISALSFKNLPDKSSILVALFMSQFLIRPEMYLFELFEKLIS